MRWMLRLLQPKHRRLEVSRGGYLFLVFTIVLGVVAIYSGNNVIYLLESLLLSALIFSGLASEFTVSRLSVARHCRQAVAGEATGDALVLRNRGWLPLYCVEVGEWRGNSFHHLQFVLHVPARGELRLRSGQALPRRGRHRWDGLAVATSFPFGFARKIRPLFAAGDRIVWPGGGDSFGPPPELTLRGEWESAEGELAEIDPWQDVSRVHWPSAARTGTLLERPRRKSWEEGVVRLLLDSDPERKEAQISQAAGRLRLGAKVLLMEFRQGAVRIEGASPALDHLALLPGGEP